MVPIVIQIELGAQRERREHFRRLTGTLIIHLSRAQHTNGTNPVGAVVQAVAVQCKGVNLTAHLPPLECILALSK